METATNPYKLRSMGCDKKSNIADLGKFRGMLTIDSEQYQVGYDRDTAREALDAVMVMYRDGCVFQVYDDQGSPRINADGRLI